MVKSDTASGGATPLSRRRVVGGAALLCSAPLLAGFHPPAPSPPAAPAVVRAKGSVVFSRAPGILYLPSHVMEKRGLVRKHADRLGLRNLNLRWVNLPAGGVQHDGLLSGELDVINAGFGPLLELWQQTGGKVKGIIASAALPLSLVSTNPRIHSVQDIGPEDKIAVPILGVSTQALLMQMAAVKLYGPDAWGRFDANCVAMNHPAALLMLKNRESAIRLHFSVPPYHFHAMRQIRGARVIATSKEIIGGHYSSAQFYTTTAFAEANPIIMEALRAAMEEARGIILKNTLDAVNAYRALSGDKSDPADLLELLAQPDMMNWHMEPQGTFAFVSHLNRIGRLKTLPDSWRDYYLPIAHDLAGS